uniref:Cilia and flagella associated protein 161 n=1 Tax=Monodelphis domestica TaxID=13616 RepID=A0A5F8H4H4_MONDO
MATKNYRNCVRMGNWNENIYLEEELMKDFLEKREKGQLLIQRNRILMTNLLKKVKLSSTGDGYVHYGDTVIVLNPACQDPHIDQVVFGRVALAVTPEEMKAHMSNEIEVPCEVTAMHDATPMGRNTFILMSMDGNAMGEPIRYGLDFGLATTAGFNDKMANTRIIIKHCHTNRALAANRNFFLRTYFGKECEVACHTHLDCYRIEKPLNYWVFCTGDPNDLSSLLVDKPRPSSEDTLVEKQASTKAQ